MEGSAACGGPSPDVGDGGVALVGDVDEEGEGDCREEDGDAEGVEKSEGVLDRNLSMQSGVIRGCNQGVEKAEGVLDRNLSM